MSFLPIASCLVDHTPERDALTNVLLATDVDLSINGLKWPVARLNNNTGATLSVAFCTYADCRLEDGPASQWRVTFADLDAGSTSGYRWLPSAQSSSGNGIAVFLKINSVLYSNENDRLNFTLQPPVSLADIATDYICNANGASPADLTCSEQRRETRWSEVE